MEAGGAHLGAHDLPGPSGMGPGPRRAEGHRSGQRRGRSGQAVDDAPLLVGADEQRDPTGVERGGLRIVRERRDLLDVLEVLAPGEVDEAAHVVGAHDLGDRVHAGGARVGFVGLVRRGAVSDGHEHLTDLLLDAQGGEQLVDPLLLPRAVGSGGSGHREGSPGERGRAERTTGEKGAIRGAGGRGGGGRSGGLRGARVRDAGCHGLLLSSDGSARWSAGSGVHRASTR